MSRIFVLLVSLLFALLCGLVWTYLAPSNAAQPTASKPAWILSLIQTTGSALVAVLLAYIGFMAITRQQVIRERLRFLKELEDQMMDLMNRQAVLLPQKGEEAFRYRNILNEKPWLDQFPNDDATTLHNYIRGDNYVDVRPDGARVSSMLLLETFIWFARVRRGLEAGLIRDRDLVTLWRYIMSFTNRRRYVFFKLYFRVRDHEQISDVCVRTFLELDSVGFEWPPNAKDHFDSEFLHDVGVARRQRAQQSSSISAKTSRLIRAVFLDNDTGAKPKRRDTQPVKRREDTKSMDIQ